VKYLITPSHGPWTSKEKVNPPYQKGRKSRFNKIEVGTEGVKLLRALATFYVLGWSCGKNVAAIVGFTEPIETT
jgi:hypothetical protein